MVAAVKSEIPSPARPKVELLPYKGRMDKDGNTYTSFVFS
jgi:hypothetical protein